MTGFRQRELPGGAVEEQCAEIIFQFPHIFGQKRLGAPGLARRGGKPLSFDNIDKGADAGQRVHENPPVRSI
ncbi:hypothetical protein D3C71_465960 [compost metagenome]